MSPQTWLLASILSILTIVFVVMAAISKSLNAFGIIAVLIWIVQVVILCYDTECLVAGNCHVWSWIRTILYLIVPTIVLIFVIIEMVKKGKNKNNSKKQEEQSKQ